MPAEPRGGSGRPRGSGGFLSLWLRFSAWVLFTRWVVWSLVAVNLVSALTGYVYWYGSDILESPPALWPFVPDSPLSATLWAAAALAVYYRRHIPFLGLLAVTGSIKYGLWTVWVWFTNSLSGGAYDLEAVVLSLNHFGMVLEGLVLLPWIRFGALEAAAVTVWYGTNDLVDYVVGRRPRLPNPEDADLIAAFAAATTLALGSVWLSLSGSARSLGFPLGRATRRSTEQPPHPGRSQNSPPDERSYQPRGRNRV